MSVNPSQATVLPPKPRSWMPLWFSALLALLYAAVWDLSIDFQMLLWGLQDMAEYLSRFSTPDFRELSRYLELMGHTLATAFWGTVLAIMLALLLAPLAARCLHSNRMLYRCAREILNLMRAMPDLLLALIFVSAMGLGPLPGLLMSCVMSSHRL